MSTCISSHGEYSEHAPLDDDFCCEWCGVFNEDAAVDSRVAAERDALLAKFEALAEEWNAASGGFSHDQRFMLQVSATRLREAIKEARA